MSASRAAAAALSAALLLLAVLPMAGPAAAYDPAVVSLSQGYPEANTSAASAFRLALEENLTACAWPGCAGLERSDSVNISIDGPDRLSGSSVGSYVINVSGGPAYAQPFTTIAVVLKTDAQGIIMSADSTAETAGNVAYTMLLNGSSSMHLSLVGGNETSNSSLYVFGYIGDGNHTTHDADQVYNLKVLPIQTRPTRTIPLNVTVSNAENVSVSGVPVSFYVKGPNDAGYTLAGNATVGAIAANGQTTVTVDWDATWADNAVYTVKAVIDPDHLFPETREDNNIRFYQVNLGSTAVEGPQDAGVYFGYGVAITFGLVVVGLWWYNRRYE